MSEQDIMRLAILSGIILRHCSQSGWGKFAGCLLLLGGIIRIGGIK